jgi:hypothetical protein
LFRSLASISGGGGVTAGNDPFGASGLFSTHHGGGIVGLESGPARELPLSTFIGAKRFHGGGLASDEIPAVLQKGEAVFTKNQLRAIQPAGSGPAPTQIVNITNNSSADVKTTKRIDSNGATVTDVVIGIVNREMAAGKFDGPLRSRTNTQIQPRGR